MLAKLKAKRGFTLVELMIVVAIIGVLAALAIYGVRKYVTNSKTAEARMMLGRISKDAVAAYAKEKMDGTLLTAGSSTGVSQSLCKESTAVPANISSVAGMKYQSAATEWGGADVQTGWRCLRFGIEGPQYYQYQYTADLTKNTFSAIANGDLDGNSKASKFQMDGAVEGGMVRVSPTVIETDPDE